MHNHDLFLELMARDYIEIRLKEAKTRHLLKTMKERHVSLWDKIIIYCGKKLIHWGEKCTKREDTCSGTSPFQYSQRSLF